MLLNSINKYYFNLKILIKLVAVLINFKMDEVKAGYFNKIIQ